MTMRPHPRKAQRLPAAGWFLCGIALVALAAAALRWAQVPFPADPHATDLAQRLLPPGAAHWLGTDALGRDVLSRLLHGSYVSLGVGLVAVVVELGIGVTIGALAGYFGGKVDAVLMRLVDAVMCFPSFFLALTAVALVGPGVLNVVLILALVGWTRAARLTRAEFLTLRESGYVQAARALGQRGGAIITRHLLPNARGPILVAAVIGVPEAILLEAGLSFLGFGVPPPAATWGSIIADGKPYLLDAWWLIVFPGAAILATTLAFYLAAESFRQRSGR
jgi:peptide/nickel transport system permease protein